jgi:hypothetical protein
MLIEPTRGKHAVVDVNDADLVRSRNPPVQSHLKGIAGGSLKGVARGDSCLQLTSSSNSRKDSSARRESDFGPPITKLPEHLLLCSTLCSLADQEVLIISKEKPLS